MPLLFLYVKDSACVRARKVLKMTSAASFYLDVASDDETQGRKFDKTVMFRPEYNYIIYISMIMSMIC